MSTIRTHHFSIRWKAFFIAALILLAVGEVGTNAWLLGESHTTNRLNKQQSSICRLIRYFGDQTQRGITTNSKLVLLDARKNTPDAKADAVIRRQSISAATTALIRIRAAQC